MFNSIVATSKSRRVKQIRFHVQHPGLVRYGSTCHVGKFAPFTDDLSLIEANVRVNMEKVYTTYAGMYNWEVDAGGLRAAKLQHWTSDTPTREVFLANQQ